MSFLDEGSGSTLADVLGAQADTAATGINQSYAKRKRKEAALAGAGGRLNSGVQNYTAADTQASQLGDLGGVYGGLADALGSVPQQDYLTNREDDRNRQLALLIGELSQSGGGVLGGISGALSGGTSGALAGFKVGGPWGAVAGGALGAGLGGYGGSRRRYG